MLHTQDVPSVFISLMLHRLKRRTAGEAGREGKGREGVVALGLTNDLDTVE